MKVRAIIKLIEQDGWYLIERVAVTASIDTTRKKVWSLLRESPVMILRQAPKTVF
jgi:hypothetical protein